MNNPSTFRAEPPQKGVGWDDHAALHRRSDGGGLLSGFKAIRHGTLTDLICFVLSLPEEEQPAYAIEKAGDHRLELAEIRALSRRTDFPGCQRT